MGVQHHHLHVPPRIRYDGDAGHFAACPGRRGNGEQRHARPGYPVIAGVFGQGTVVGGHDRDALARVDAAAAPDRDDAVAILFPEQGESLLDVHVGGIGRYAAIDVGFDPRLAALCRDTARQAPFHQVGVGHDQHPAHSGPRGLSGRFVEGARARDDGGRDVDLDGFVAHQVTPRMTLPYRI